MHSVKYLVLIFILMSCNNEGHYESKIIHNGKIEFSLSDKKYHSVVLGTDILGKWQLFPMKKNKNVWEIVFYNTGKRIQYKYLIDNSYWMRDPLNKNKIKLLSPYRGFNSFIN